MTRLTVFGLIIATMIFGISVGYAKQATPAATPDLAPTPQFTFRPAGDMAGSGFYDIVVEPGNAVSLTVSMGNGGSIPFEAITYAADAYTTRNGGFALVDFGLEPTGVTTWLDYPTFIFEAIAGQVQERTFSIAVPDDVPPGEYVTGIALQTANPVNEADTNAMFRYDQYIRSVIAIRVTVPGPMQAELQVGDPSLVLEGNIYGLVIPLTNTGNQQTKPTGDLRVYSESGELVLSSPIALGNIYGGHQTELWIGLQVPPSAGYYTVDLTLVDLEKNVSVEQLAMPLVVDEVAALAVTEPTVSITSASMTPLPSAEDVQFIAVDAVVQNLGEPVTGAQLSLVAYLDGEEVERFPVVQALSLQAGETPITTRYIPATGWTSGTWTFELLIETVEPGGAAVVVAHQPIEGIIIIP